ncbi:hypothetical protein FRB96_006949 [Tulasnella sp. 330]|nr:hypothetical protein FRB96_006949 [Tulasnella sp. 330]
MTTPGTAWTIKDAVESGDSGSAVTVLCMSAIAGKELRAFNDGVLALLKLPVPINALEDSALQLVPGALLGRFALDEDLLQLLELLGKHGNPKEVLMAVDESLEMIVSAFEENEDGDPNSHTAAVKLKIVMDIYGNGLPRLPIGKKFTFEATISPILRHLKRAFTALVPDMTQADTQVVLGGALMFIRGCHGWCVARRQGDSEDAVVNKSLTGILHTIVSASSAHIGAFLSLSTWATCFPKLVVPSRRVNTEEGGKVGRVLGQEALSISTLLGATSDSRLQGTRSEQASDAIASLVLLAHETATGPDVSSTTLASIGTLEVSLPAVLASLTAGRGTDEAMSWILSCLRPETRKGTASVSIAKGLLEATVLPLTPILVSIASLHPEPAIRQMTLSVLSLVIQRADSDTVRLQVLDELCNDCPYPQMRVASIELAKKSILEALDNERPSAAASTSEPSMLPTPHTPSSLPLFASPDVLPMVLKILTPDPPDLFTSPSTSPESFLESHEPGRLVEALGMFYVLNQRDTSNRTHIRDIETRRLVHTTLLFPLKEFLSRMQVDETSGELVGPHMGLFALEIALERIEAMVVSE